MRHLVGRSVGGGSYHHLNVQILSYFPHITTQLCYPEYVSLYPHTHTWNHCKKHAFHCVRGSHLNIKAVFPGIEIPIIKMKRSLDRLCFIMGVSILARRHFYIETPHPHTPRIPIHSEKEQTNLSTILLVSLCQYTVSLEMFVFQVTMNISLSSICLFLSVVYVIRTTNFYFRPGGAVDKVALHVAWCCQRKVMHRIAVFHAMKNITKYAHINILITVSEFKYIKRCFFAGVHANYGPSGVHCRTSRAEYPAFCASLDSREATDDDVWASISTGHNCCTCGFTKEGTRFLVQRQFCSGSTTPGAHTCIPAGGCGTVSSTFCRHNICEYHSISYIRADSRMYVQ